MPRVVTVVLPSARTDDLVADLRRMDGLLTLQVVRGASVAPPGDVVAAELTARSLPPLMRLLDGYGAGVDPDVSVTTTEPMGIVSPSSRDTIAREPASSTLEEMELLLDRESTMGLNKTLVMLAAGVIATVGIATNSVHIVIGAMVIAPGFEPLVRVALATVAAPGTWWRGARDIAIGYGALVIGAALAALVLPVLGIAMPADQGGYLSPGVLAGYWDRVTVAGTVVAAAGGLAGAFLVAANRSVLTAGVMIVLALVPAAALTGVGLATGDLAMAGGAALRLLHDAVIVFAAGLVVLGAKRASRHRRLRV